MGNKKKDSVLIRNPVTLDWVRLTGAINKMTVGYKTTFCLKLFEKTQA